MYNKLNVEINTSMIMEKILFLICFIRFITFHVRDIVEK